jgi:DNA-directed RNA polymerase II subunit RPB2
MDSATTWNILNKYFNDNPQALVRHHIDSYNDFYKNGIYQIFKEKNPVTIYSDVDDRTGEYMRQCKMYMGGKNGDKIYFGKPVIHDKDNVHYMFPNEARLRNMNYSMTIHYDIDIEFIDTLRPGEIPTVIGDELINEAKKGGIGIDGEYENGNDDENKEGTVSEQVDKELQHIIGGSSPVDKTATHKPESTKKIKEKKSDVRFTMTTKAAAKLREISETSDELNTQTRTHTLEKIYLGKFPVMLQSDFCILEGMPKEMRHSMGECRNDLGGYFIIDGKEKTIVSQEKFADNMLYVRKMNDDKLLYSAEMKSVSENPSKPMRTFRVSINAPTPTYTNKQIVVHIPNVRSPVPLFIVFRALGILSDKDIISYCLLDMEKYESMVDLFIPSVHDASTIMTQDAAIKYIALLTKGKGVTHALEILTDFFLPHVGETNYISKAYSLGNIVFRLLSVYTGLEPETDRDNFKYKRIELVGTLLYDLFREYWTIQLKNVHLEFEKKLYYNQELYEKDLFGLITQHYRDAFKIRDLETGFKKAYKGNWGAYTHTKREGAVQDLNRLSFNSALNHLRKTSLPLDPSLKIVGPRLLHNSQWGYIDPIDTPDGGSIGLHKHLALSTYITQGVSREPTIEWLREKWSMKLVEEYTPITLSHATRVIVNGFLVGAVETPIECIKTFRLYRRNALIPIYFSATFDIQLNTIFVYTDAGRLCRPIFYRDDDTHKLSYQSKTALKKMQDNEFSWEDLITGFNKKRDTVPFSPEKLAIYKLFELYEGIDSETNPAKIDRFLKDKAVIDYIDSSESENALIAMNTDAFETSLSDASPTKYTHCEIHNSLVLGMMTNLGIFPENNPATRNLFSCGQSKQASSVYHTNYQVRMDKTSVVLNSGQIPLVKSRFFETITQNENVYGENAMVAIACYTGYNVEDAMLLNEGALKRGLFRTSYCTCYESHEESDKTGDIIVEKKFMNIYDNPQVIGKKPGFDYSKLDEHGIIREGTLVDDKTVLIGLVTSTIAAPDSGIVQESVYKDASKTPKKGQLGIVDRVFITDDEEGRRIAKVRILEQRIPTLGDKLASRSGQKGTVGMVIRECDMPFTAEGVRPDIIINPHAIPSRMTIGQLVECVTGKACAVYGGFGDCTAFNNKGSKIGVFGEMLVKEGFHSNGNEIMYNGMTGEQMETEIFMGPTYYLRLKHMVKDKVNFRARGPTTALTRQPVSGRANDGGLRIGEMERDTIISHGMTNFMRESMMERADKYYLAVCNNTGMISIYNPSKGLFISPMADGPLQYTGSLESESLRLKHVTKFGRSFSIVCIPYSFKLLVQELQTMNVQMRIITDDNIDQMESMSFSQNINKLMGTSFENPLPELQTKIDKQLRNENQPYVRTPMNSIFTPDSPANKSPEYAPDGSPEYAPNKSPEYAPDGSPEYAPDGSPEYAPTNKSTEWGSYDPNATPSPAYAPTNKSTDWGSYDPNATPSPENIDDAKTGGNGGTRYNTGERVCKRNCKDNFKNRPWEVVRAGPKFITIRALDETGLSGTDNIDVVTAFDIFPESQAQVYTQPQFQPNQMMDQPPVAQPFAQPSIIIAPKFFNGDGNDNSVQPQIETVTDTDQITDMQPNIVVKDNKPEPTNKEKSNGEIDFSNLVIKKMGQ